MASSARPLVHSPGVSWRPKVEDPATHALKDADFLLSIDHPHPLFFYRAVFTGLTGEVTEWPIVHDWKSCVPYKGTEGSLGSAQGCVARTRRFSAGSGLEVNRLVLSREARI